MSPISAESRSVSSTAAFLIKDGNPASRFLAGVKSSPRDRVAWGPQDLQVIQLAGVSHRAPERLQPVSHGDDAILAIVASTAYQQTQTTSPMMVATRPSASSDRRMEMLDRFL